MKLSQSTSSQSKRASKAWWLRNPVLKDILYFWGKRKKHFKIEFKLKLKFQINFFVSVEKSGKQFFSMFPIKI